jgi:AraC family transcriptional regulator
LAELANLSPFHFTRAFKQSVGVAPHRYQTQLRIDRAQQMLQHSKAPVTEIALGVGYESSQALARAFLRHVGTAPSAWRRSHDG